METRPTTAVALHHLRILGTTVTVDLTGASASLLGRFREAWELCLTTPSTSAADAPVVPLRVDASAGASEGGSEPTESRALMGLTQDITRAAIEQRAGTALLFHAGAVAHPETGAALVYVAPGGTGKTTLTRTLGQGRGYITDETVAVVEDRVIHPYPKPLSVRRHPFDGLKDEMSPRRLGLAPVPVEPWVAGIVMLRRDPSLSEVVVEEVAVLDAIALIAPETSSLGRLERPLHRLAQLIEATGGVRLLRYAEATALLPVVEDVLGRGR